VHAAHADAWEAEGRLREHVGGGVLAARGLRLVASGLPQPYLNGGDVTAPDPDLDAARAFYAARNVAFGLRVPAGMAWRHGRRIMRLRVMALEPGDFRPAAVPAGLALHLAIRDDLDAIAAVDAAAFGGDPATVAAWIGPHLGAERIETALARLDGAPVGTGYANRTDESAGPAVALGGVAVVPTARRRGVAGALSSWLLARAFAAGAQLAHLQADSDDATRVYARLGFVDTEPLDVYVDI
jgi:predicted N-acetyltransferase YhbS